MNNINKLEKEVRKRLSGGRLKHVISVRDECEKLAYLFELSDADRNTLSTAALLHDITKMKKGTAQIELADELGIALSDDDIASPSVLHSITGAEIARREFSDYVDKEICEAILVHTTGKPDMSLIDKLLFLADYIEPLREYDDCIKVRSFFYNGIGTMSLYERKKRLNATLILAFDLTIELLVKDNQIIHPKTVLSRNFLLANS